MAIFRGTIRSEALGMDTGLAIVLPYDRPAALQKTPCKTLYLLHGLGDNSEAWTRYTAVERYARDKGVAVVMPEVQRSFYADMQNGLRYFTYIADELPDLCVRLFQISAAPADTYIAGLSMGGYGALKCAFTHPERYAGCASFSGAVHIARILRDTLADRDDKHLDEFRAVFGQQLSIPPEAELFHLAERLTRLPLEVIPDLYITCGEEDFLFDDNLVFKDHLEKLELPFVFEQWPGAHTWDFWDESVRRMLDRFLPG